MADQDFVADTINRLENWRFEQALSSAEHAEISNSAQQAIFALARAFGDPGWFAGYMGDVVHIAVTQVIDQIKRAQRKETA